MVLETGKPVSLGGERERGWRRRADGAEGLRGSGSGSGSSSEQVIMVGMVGGRHTYCVHGALPREGGGTGVHSDGWIAIGSR